MSVGTGVRPWFLRVASFVPVWMTNRPGFSTFAKALFTTALFCDIATQAALEGVRAGFPGYDARTDNLNLIGASRGLWWGETETAASFAARLRAWLVTAVDMGGDVGLALQLWRYIADTPQIRVISRNGLFTTVAQDGTVTQVQGTWNWDSVSNPERATNWWDCWIVAYPDHENGYYVDDVGVWGDSGTGLPSNGDLGWGHTCTRKEVGVIRSIIAAWKGAHVNLKCMIWCNGTDFYAPTPVSGSPDGTWGKAFVQSTNLPSRNTVDDFWGMGSDTNAW